MPAMLATLLFTALQSPAIEGPEPPPSVATRPRAAERQEAAWSAERRRLQVHAGLSGAFAGAMLLTGTLLMVTPGPCTGPNCELPLGRVITGMALASLAPIPLGTGIYWGVRLHRHNRQRPGALLRPGAGGFVIHF